MDFNGRLENGVELYTCTNPSIRAFCLSLWIRRGSMHEPAEHHGLAHFLEHAVFRSMSERMGGALYRRLARLGLNFDACTYTSYVRFEISGPAARFGEAVDIMMMVLEPPVLSVEAIDLERGRIQKEIEEGAGDAADSFANAIIWRGTQHARTIAGTIHSTNLIGFEDLKCEHARWFSRGNFFFCATGNLPDMASFIDRLRDIAPGEGTPVVTCAPVPEVFFHRDADIEIQDADYVGLRFNFDVDVARHSEMAHMLLLDHLLGDLGRLYLALSEDRALVYNLNDSFERFSNVGNLSFDFEVERKSVGEAVQIVVDELNRAKAMGEDDFETQREAFLAYDELLQDDACRFNNYWGYDNGLYGAGFESPEARMEAYRRISIEELRAMSREIFRPDNLTLCLRGREKWFSRGKIRRILIKLR